MAVQCPYCGESKSESGLRGHILLQNDPTHGPLGQFPDDYESPVGTDEWDAIRDIGSESDEEDERAGGGLGRLRSLLG